MKQNIRLWALAAIAILAMIAALLAPPIAQDPAYHDFADKRALLGIDNFGDVVGNLPFTLFGLMGLYVVCRRRASFTMRGERALWGLFFFGAALVGLGSGYYHLDPNNETLVWDRLPMTIAFMSFFALVIMERICEKAGLWLAPFLLVLGIASVFYWDYTESLTRGDLRPYALVQFLPLLLVPLMLWLFPARYSGLKYLGLTLGWYVLAKLLEHFDEAVFEITQQAVSGHTLKHLAAAMGVYTILLYVRKREALS